MKYVIALFAIVLAIGFAACGGSDTTTVVKQAPPTQAAPMVDPETQQAQDLVEIMKPSAYQCDAATTLPYAVGLRSFTQGYGANTDNPDAEHVFSALVAYCAGERS